MHLQPPLTDLPGADKVVERSSRAAAAARKAGVEVMYVNIGFRPGYPEVASDDPAREAVVARQTLIAGVNNAVHEALTPHEGELEFTTPHCNAFSGTDLENFLRMKDINHIVVTGIATSGVVMGTVTDANDRKFKITVLADAVMDFQQHIHDALLQVFATPPRRAGVVSVDDWVAELEGVAAAD